MSNQNAKLMRWSFELQRHTLDVRHRPGKLNLLPDLLSRPSSALPQSLIFADVAHLLCDSHLQVVEPRLHLRAKTLLCVVAGGKSVHRATPSCASPRPRGGSHASGGGRSVTCTAFPHVTLHSQPFPYTRLDAVLWLHV